VAANKLKVGDIVTPSAEAIKRVPQWKDSKLKIINIKVSNLDSKVTTEILDAPNLKRNFYGVGDISMWYAKYLELVTSSQSVPSKKCICEISVIVAKGCQCGGK